MYIVYIQHTFISWSPEQYLEQIFIVPKKVEHSKLVMFIVFFVTFPCGILGQVWYLVVSFPDLCRHSYFYVETSVFRNSVIYSVSCRMQFPPLNFV